ncbi:MAG: patatin-like phospholipase family protein [Nitrospiraceae bacterium]
MPADSTKQERYRILSIDGGGIRGVYAAVLLDRLAVACPSFLEHVDLVAGTSTGAIIALGLANDLAPSDLVKLYKDHAAKIFDDSWLDDLKDVGGLYGADYDNEKLRDVLKGIFGKKKLAGLGKRVLVPAFDLDSGKVRGKVRMWQPKFFHNFPGPDSDGSELVVDVALRTCAAPTYFPSYQGYIDGSVVAINPSVAALAQALDGQAANQRLENVRLFSIGTGLNPSYIEGQDLDWGFAQWARPLITLMSDGVMGVADYQCANLLREHYHRLASVLPEAVALDDVSKTDDLIRYAKAEDLTDTLAWLQEHFD